MQAAPPKNEAERLVALRRFQVLDTPAEDAFDRITSSAARQLGVPMALITLIDERRQWFKSRFGLEVSETPREHAFCAHALEHTTPMAVADACEDPRFRDNPLVTAEPCIRSYCGAPLRLESGVVLGTLCVVDRRPRRFTDEEQALLADMAQVIVDLLEFRRAALSVVRDERASAVAAEGISRERAEALRASEERYRDLTTNLPGLVFQYRLSSSGDATLPFVGSSAGRMLGLEAAAPERLWSSVHAAERSGFEQALAASRDGLSVWRWQGRMRCADGGLRWFRLSATPRRQADGGTLWNGILLDVTQELQAEERLRQTQKLEAIGQMTSGVAHDFNNLLAVIQGNAELLTDEVGADHPCVQAVMRASKRGSELIERLLAFSRLRSLRPQAVDVGELARGTAGMLDRTLGRQITVTTDAQADLWPAIVDPGEVENALVNLAINARDAMPAGGIIRIAAANVDLAEADTEDLSGAVPGHYVAISVEDRGHGMSEEVRARALEPFFTTKPDGQGNGLGLSMVYGFVRQSGGCLRIDSGPERGTAVTLYLPRARLEPAASPAAEAAGEVRRLACILLLEDDEDVRRMALRILKESGYRVVPASDVETARLVLDEVERIDLLLSDIQLSGSMTGIEFAREARHSFPDIKVVFMSGYPANAIGDEAKGLGDAPLLRKPFKRSALDETIRRVLGL